MARKRTKPDRLKMTRGSALDVITRRAERLAEAAGVSFERGRAMTILLSVHHGCCPLRVTDLARAREFDLAHDVFGIIKHYDPIAGNLTDCFIPRHAVRQ